MAVVDSVPHLMEPLNNSNLPASNSHTAEPGRGGWRIDQNGRLGTHDRTTGHPDLPTDFTDLPAHRLFAHLLTNCEQRNPDHESLLQSPLISFTPE